MRTLTRGLQRTKGPRMTTSRPWLLYGANGYTGRLVAEEAIRRGHRPILAGRSADKVRPLAESLGLPWAAFGLDDISRIAAAIAGADLVFHAAGPFVHTSEAMVTACLARGAHYVDVSGEIPVLTRTLDRDEEAKRRGVCLISGVGFDVIPTDCLAKHVADQLPDARYLDIAFASSGGSSSAGTTKSMIEMLPGGNFARREGALVPIPVGGDVRTFRFSDKLRTAMAIPWGDLETAYKTTGIPNITTYMALPPGQARALRLLGPSLVGVLKNARIRNAALKWAGEKIDGPDEAQRKRDRSYVYACAKNPDGRAVEGWLETINGYALTAAGGVLAVERILSDSLVGAWTPALAFGADFVLSIEGTKRFDSL
jgi:short subunit dehydrogenase-like uncharacterized protein